MNILTKLAKIQYREKIFVHGIESYSNEGNGDCIPYFEGFFPVTYISISIYRDLTDDKSNKLQKKMNICGVEDCIDKMLIHISKKWKGDPTVRIKENLLEMIIK